MYQLVAVAPVRPSLISIFHRKVRYIFVSKFLILNFATYLQYLRAIAHVVSSVVNYKDNGV